MKNLVFFILISLLATSCITDYDGGPFFGNGIKGEGPLTNRTFDMDGFETLKLTSTGEFYLSQGESYSIKVESQENILDALEVETSGDQLQVSFKKNIKSYESLKFYITLPKLEAISLTGSGDVFGESAFSGIDGLDLDIAGSGDIQLEVKAQSIDISIAGSGDINLSGSAEEIDIDIKGSGDVLASSLSLREATISIAGSGNCELDVSDKLDVSIAGSGDVLYTGSPKTNMNIAGSGEVKAKQN